MKSLFPFYSIGHFINQPNSKTEFEITLFEEMEEPDVDDLHKHTFYEILWVDEGKSRQTIDYQSYDLGTESLFFISPGQLHEFEAWQGLKGGTIMFTAEFFLLNQQNTDKLFELSFLDNYYTTPQLQLSTASFKDIRKTIDWLLQEKQRKDTNPAILQSLLHVLLLQAQRTIDTNTSTTTSKNYIIIYKKFKSLIEKHFHKGLTASDYATQLHLSQHHLNLAVKQVTGKTATEVIRARAILEAKRLLTFTDLSVSEIAAELGYFDSSYFAKIFKKESGLSPKAFRNQMSEKYRNQ